MRKLFILILLLPTVAFAQPSGGGFSGPSGTTASVAEESGGVRVYNPYEIKFPDGTVTDNADGTVSIDTTPGGVSDVDSVGDCAEGACLDGSSDGGTFVELYSNDGASESCYYFTDSEVVQPTKMCFTGTILTITVNGDDLAFFDSSITSAYVLAEGDADVGSCTLDGSCIILEGGSVEGSSMLMN